MQEIMGVMEKDEWLSQLPEMEKAMERLISNIRPVLMV